MSRPDFTIVQKVAVVVGGIPIVANLLRAFDVYSVTPDQMQALQDAGEYGIALAGALVLGDLGLRAVRNWWDVRTTQAGTSAAEAAATEAAAAALAAVGNPSGPGAEGLPDPAAVQHALNAEAQAEADEDMEPPTDAELHVGEQE